MVDRKIEDDGASERTILIDKVKNGPDGAKWAFDLLRVDLGHDKDGDLISSCVPEYRGFVAKKKTRASGQNNRDRLVLSALNACIEAGQLLNVPAVPPMKFDTQGVLRESLKERLRDMGYWGADDNDDTAKRRINRDILRLVEQNLLCADPDMVWLPSVSTRSS